MKAHMFQRGTGHPLCHGQLHGALHNKSELVKHSRGTLTEYSSFKCIAVPVCTTDS